MEHQQVGIANPDTWDGLRKQARKLESELDAKLSSYRKVANSPGQDAGYTAESEIEGLLQQLQQVNSNMQLWSSSVGLDVFSHTLARHKDILHELTMEFRRLRSSARAKREHEELLESFSRVEQKQSLSNGETVDPAHQLMLQEQGLLYNSTTQMDNVIAQAQAAFSSLTSQRLTFNDISSKILSVGAKLPSVNGVLTAIRQKKSRDTIVLSLVASLCTILILLYWLAK